MTNAIAASVQLELPMPAAPDTSPILATIEARLEAIVVQALPAARSRRETLQTVWASTDASAVEIFLDARHTVFCHPVGADRLSAAAAMESALAGEAAALQELVDALELYDAGGRSVTDPDGGGAVLPLMRDEDAGVGQPALNFSTLKDRTAHLRAVRAYLHDVDRELQRAMKERRADAVATLKAERSGADAHVKTVIGEVRRRRRAASRRIA